MPRKAADDLAAGIEVLPSLDPASEPELVTLVEPPAPPSMGTYVEDYKIDEKPQEPEVAPEEPAFTGFDHLTGSARTRLEEEMAAGRAAVKRVERAGREEMGDMSDAV